jgi:hypothetical protein
VPLPLPSQDREQRKRSRAHGAQRRRPQAELQRRFGETMMRHFGSLLVAALVVVGLPHLTFAQLPHPPVGIAMVWVDDSGNGAIARRTWTDSNGNGRPDCFMLNFFSNGECGDYSPSFPLPFLQFAVMNDPGPGGSPMALSTYCKFDSGHGG